MCTQYTVSEISFTHANPFPFRQKKKPPRGGLIGIRKEGFARRNSGTSEFIRISDALASDVRGLCTQYTVSEISFTHANPSLSAKRKSPHEEGLSGFESRANYADASLRSGYSVALLLTVFRGSDSPPDCHSVPLPLRIPPCPPKEKAPTRRALPDGIAERANSFALVTR